MTFFEILNLGLSANATCYNSDVQIVNFPPNYTMIGVSGICPHCAAHAYLRPVGGPYIETDPQANYTVTTMCCAVQCEACKNLGIAVGARRSTSGNANYALVAFYPTGKPNDIVDDAIPEAIRMDFREAKRCRWVNAYKAAVVMCRRAVQASCVALGAKKNKLIDQIDEIAAMGIITSSLRDFAHEIRLEGNDGAHPGKDGLEDVTEKDADDILEFTDHFFNHVYVMPARLNARKPASPAAATAASP